MTAGNSSEILVALKANRCLLVVTNVSSQSQGLKLLVEIPSGAVALGANSYLKRTHFVNIPSWSTDKVSFRFHFPSIPSGGRHFHSFPVIVAKHRTNEIVSWNDGERHTARSPVDRERATTRLSDRRWRIRFRFDVGSMAHSVGDWWARQSPFIFLSFICFHNLPI